jgi:hypothetical protein
MDAGANGTGLSLEDAVHFPAGEYIKKQDADEGIFSALFEGAPL